MKVIGCIAKQIAGFNTASQAQSMTLDLSRKLVKFIRVNLQRRLINKMFELIIIVIVFLAGLAIGSAVTISVISEKMEAVKVTLQKIKLDLESGKLKVNK
ncbi:MAG: hypothetical protein ACI9T9_000743 [Oleiphilaceae bacterium]